MKIRVTWYGAYTALAANFAGFATYGLASGEAVGGTLCAAAAAVWLRDAQRERRRN